jgi:hypothetical protein
MANRANGVNYLKSLTPSSENILDPGILGGKLRVHQDYFTVAATSVTSKSYVAVGGKLPTGSQVVDIQLEVPVSMAPGTNSYIKVGDEGDDDRYITTTIISTSTTNVTYKVFNGPNVATGMNYQVTGVTDNYIRITNPGVESDTGDNTWTAGTIKVSVLYVVE